MANVRDSDTSLWLHNKLGTSNDSWTGGSICSQLNAEVLRNIKDCFPDLQTQVKLKLLLSFFHIPRRNVLDWRAELEEILEVAQVDSEQWVSMLAEIMKTFPATGSLNTDISEVDENRRIFSDLVNDLKKLVKKQNDMNMLPLECHYVNKNVLGNVVGNQPALVKHFTLKRKPKSAALRVDLLHKSVDAASNLKKNTAPMIPVRSRGMPRKMTDTTPLKGIPSRVPPGGFRSTGLTSTSLSRPTLPRTPAGRKDGGIKLLDITEQPLGYAQAKKRKRMQELEEASKKAAAAAAEALQQANVTPDYAAGLIPSNPPTPAPPTNDFAPPTPSTPVLSSTSVHVPSAGESLLLPSPVTPQLKTTQYVSVLGTPASKVSVLNQSAVVVTNIGTVSTPATPTQTLVTNPKVTPAVDATTPTTSKVSTGQVIQVKQAQQVKQFRLQQQQPASPGAAVNAANKKGLSLTREQMLEAQIMFRTANKVTRPEKALILGFMAGSRDNPCPDLGNIVTIKLSENQESVMQTDDTYVNMMAETHFQMNYNTGEWKRIKKYRKADDVSNTQIVVRQQTSSAQVPISPT